VYVLYALVVADHRYQKENRMKRFVLIGLCVLIVTLSLLIPSCRREGALTSRLVVTAVGFDRTENGIAVSVSAIQPLKVAAGATEQEGRATAVTTATASSVETALQLLGERGGRRPYWRQNQLLVLSESFCRELPLLGGDAAHPRLPVAVVRGAPASLLEVEGADTLTAVTLVKLLTLGAEQGISVRRTFLDLERARAQMWDLTLPILSVREKQAFHDGTAVFKAGRLALTLTRKETVAYVMLAGESRSVSHAAEVLYTAENLKTRLEIERDGIRFRYRFTVTGKGDADTAAFLKTQAEAMLRRLDAAQTDPLGLARRTANAFPDVTQKTVSSQLSACEKTVSVTLG
jgi:hypothetical protein